MWKVESHFLNRHTLSFHVVCRRPGWIALDPFAGNSDQVKPFLKDLPLNQELDQRVPEPVLCCHMGYFGCQEVNQNGDVFYFRQGFLYKTTSKCNTLKFIPRNNLRLGNSPKLDCVAGRAQCSSRLSFTCPGLVTQACLSPSLPSHLSSQASLLQTAAPLTAQAMNAIQIPWADTPGPLVV